eukprot:NODE_2801_length_1087_cov_67.769792_g2671_i0.p1 GENE.NODE_2801_length_1087_cov_67.769792_g2671_i0~~NODE_2801_length_1087_cov_67.769792_g2671_i0.p1  ORF type:complete len:339 (+),score=45.93 NODE_2801_length_1087_cov_67.769792_g2671_i0:43-1017(+)
MAIRPDECHPLWPGDNRADGGIMPQRFDTVPNERSDTLRTKYGTRQMRFGPSFATDIPPDTIPNGGQQVFKKELYTRGGGGPWTSTTKPKEFGQPGYLSDTQVGNPQRTSPFGRSRQGQNTDWSEHQEGRNKGLPGRLPGRGYGGSTRSDLPPMRTGKVSPPLSTHPHIADGDPKISNNYKSGLQMKTGRAPGIFDQGIHKGEHQVAHLKPAGLDKIASLSGQPAPLAKMRTNMRKQDYFGSYPEHMADPYVDDPLADSQGRWAKGKRGIYTSVSRVKPCHPVVNVWDSPAGLQTRGGVKVGHSKISGEKVNFVSDVGRLGTTV